MRRTCAQTVRKSRSRTLRSRQTARHIVQIVVAKPTIMCRIPHDTALTLCPPKAEVVSSNLAGSATKTPVNPAFSVSDNLS